jgi:hypothetical protein
VTPDEIPQELIDLLDARAGKQHSRTGSVVSCLAEILTRYEELRCGDLSTSAGTLAHDESPATAGMNDRRRRS